MFSRSLRVGCMLVSLLILVAPILLGFHLLPFPPASSAFSNSSTPVATVTYSGFSPASGQGPEGIAFDQSGNLWVADDSGYVYEFTPNDISTHSAPSVSIQVQASTTGCTTSNVWGIAFDHSGNLWVSDACSNSIYEYTTPFTSSSTPAQTIFNSHMVPRDIAFDSGNLWVANGTFSGGKGSVLEFASPGSSNTPTITITNAANGCNGVLQEPFALTFDSNGNLWIGDFPSTCSTSYIYEYSAPTFTGNPAPTTVINGTNFGCPIGLAFDSSGNLWNGDPCARQVEEFLAPIASGLSSPSPSVILTKNDSTGGVLGCPVSDVFGPHGNLWVGDECNHAVYEYAISGSTVAVPDIPFGSIGIVVATIVAIAAYVLIRYAGSRKMPALRPLR